MVSCFPLGATMIAPVAAGQRGKGRSTKFVLFRNGGCTIFAVAVATNLAQLHTPPHVVEKLLNHASGTISGVAAIYNRFQYFEEMRGALAKWEARLKSLISS